MAEGNFGARDQINLQDSGGLRVIANCNNCNDLQLLETVFGERLAALGGRAVVLESLVKAIRESGYQGTELQAATTVRHNVPAGQVKHVVRRGLFRCLTPADFIVRCG
jgi:hypothetical protein